ncbi:MAG: hypothetical protein HMLKMBBP_04002 [Planctomycetes bacterium]|nr:hypothetical protein [Planctomycetota bacterium]
MMGERRPDGLAKAIVGAGPPPLGTERRDWKNYAERLSTAVAQAFANSLRRSFKGVLPSADGAGRESLTRGEKGMKRLDVNYSNTLHGLGFGVSIKTINKPDPKTGNFRKNFTRVDGELRAEATDHHRRQPYAVLVAVILLPEAACRDGSGERASSFGQAVRHFRPRNHRVEPSDEADTFERVFVGVYADDGHVSFIDVNDAPPRHGPPHGASARSFAQVVDEIDAEYRRRNQPKFLFDDGRP